MGMTLSAAQLKAPTRDSTHRYNYVVIELTNSRFFGFLILEMKIISSEWIRNKEEGAGILDFQLHPAIIALDLKCVRLEIIQT